jgi:hypothetical protein
MSFLDFFRNLIELKITPTEALKLEEVVMRQAGQSYLRDGEPKEDEKAMERRISITRLKIWESINREIKKGESIERILDLLL